MNSIMKICPCMYKYVYKGENEYGMLDDLIMTLQKLQAWSGGINPIVIISKNMIKEINPNYELIGDIKELFGWTAIENTTNDDVLIMTFRDLNL